MTASLTAIRAAIRERLDTLLDTADPAGPFAAVKNWAGELTRDRNNNPGLDALGTTPAVLLAFGREVPATTTHMTSGEVSQVLAQEWVLFVVVENAQDPDASVGTLDACLDAVVGCVLGTQVDDAVMPLELGSVVPWWAAPGSYCYAVTVRVSRQAARTPGVPDDAVPFERFEGGLSVPETGTEDLSNVNPVANAAVDLEEP